MLVDFLSTTLAFLYDQLFVKKLK